MSAPKKPTSTNANANTDDELLKLDWVLDKHQRPAAVSLLAFMSKNDRDNLDFVRCKQKDGKGIRVRMDFTEVDPDSGEEVSRSVWTSKGASKQMMDHFDTSLEEFTHGAVKGLRVQEYYKTDPDTNQRLRDENKNFITDFIVTKQGGESTKVKNLEDLM